MAKAQTAAAPASAYEIDTDVAMPVFKRASTRKSGYPFDQLQVGQSFHIAESEENPDPVARIRSSVSNARDQYAEVILGSDGEPEMVSRNTRKGPGMYAKKRLTRDFKVVGVGAEDPKGKGARVFRTL